MSINFDNGFDRKRIINYNTDSFDCAFCSCVPRVPRQCASCDTIYCRLCIEKWFKQSNGESRDNCCQQKTITNLCQRLQKNYNDLLLRCMKCQEAICINQIDSHEFECGLIKQCINFQCCGNIIPQDNMNNDTIQCSDQCCQFLSQVKNIKNKQEIFKRAREFLLSNPFNKSHLPISDEERQNIMNPFNQITIGNSPIVIRWDKSRCGSNIILTDGDQKAFLHEPAFVFKSVVADYGFESGIAYWEIEADDRTENQLKIGVTTQRDFNFNSSFCDFEFGWAFYGLGQTRHNQKQNGTNFGKQFKDKGTLGVCLNMDQGTLMFSLNGDNMGCAFKDEKLKRGPIYPAVALFRKAGCKIIGEKPVPQIFQQF
ncbi:unnamed protein product [Paramecium octaurelia]|uniref:B30.2/SPRY domain-containing protein n=1 Tax=Paramecium octaurelia TaxID=43137 RepID=A0A8S1WK82_PAROT|nr:unnamed protein product [Paramecium octaurelia]